MFVIITFLQYSLGIYILNGRSNWTEIFRLPLIYAALAGLSVNLAQISLPELLLRPISQCLGQATIPIMLHQLGLPLARGRVAPVGPRGGRRCWRASAAASLRRILAVHLIGAEGVNRQVLLLYGALPAAVVNFCSHRKVSTGSRAGGLNRRDQHIHFDFYHSSRLLADTL